MNKWYIEFYYAREYGIIVVDVIPLEGKPFPTPVNPMIYSNREMPYEALGTIAIERMTKAAHAQPISQEDTKDYWHISGIRSFKKFSLTFSNLVAFSDDAGIHIKCMKALPKTGGYDLDRSKSPIDLPLDVSPTVLGKILLSELRKMDADKKAIDTDRETIETIFGEQLSFLIPNDDFEDHGDEHTDAYKIYRHLRSNGTFLGFMIDSGYKGFDEESIREKWEQWYGTLISFNYERAVGKTIVTASTEKSEIESYLYRRGDEVIELLTVIDKTVFTARELKKVRDIYDTVAQSVDFKKTRC